MYVANHTLSSVRDDAGNVKVQSKVSVHILDVNSQEYADVQLVIEDKGVRDVFDFYVKQSNYMAMADALQSLANQLVYAASNTPVPDRAISGKEEH